MTTGADAVAQLPVHARAVRWVADEGLPDEREVLAGVDLDLGPRDRIGLAGRSGSGKTTLATILAGLLEPTSGEVAGRAVLVFQDPERGFFEETVLEDVAFGPRNAGLPESEARQRAETAMRTVGLDPDRFGNRAPETLSGGEARRAAIAGVLALSPRAIVFDEPTTGLDADGVAGFRDILRALREEGAAYLVVSHESSLLAAECERVLVLAEGLVVADGSSARGDESPAGERELARVADALRTRGWLTEDVPATVETIVEAWAAHA